MTSLKHLEREIVERLEAAKKPINNDRFNYEYERDHNRIIETVISIVREAFTAHERAAAVAGGVDRPTEEMCRRARGFILALDLGCRSWKAMQKNLSLSAYPTLDYIEEQAKKNPNGHITKWDIADCIWQLMAGASRVSPSSEATQD